MLPVIFPDVLRSGKAQGVIIVRVPADVSPDHGQKLPGGHVRGAPALSDGLLVSNDLRLVSVRVGAEKGRRPRDSLPAGEVDFSGLSQPP
jgi:hypothetical protein